MKHFKPGVPVSIQDKILSVVELAKDDFINEQNQEVMISCENTEEISGVAYSGFIPFQDGGYCLSALYRCDVDSTFHLTKKQTEWVNEDEKNMLENFYTEHNIKTDDKMTDVQHDMLSEYESEWFGDGAWLTLNVFCCIENNYLGNNKEKTVTVQLLFNYKDGEYKRDKYADELYVKVYSFDEFLSLTDTEIIVDIKY